MRSHCYVRDVGLHKLKARAASQRALHSSRVLLVPEPIAAQKRQQRPSIIPARRHAVVDPFDDDRTVRSFEPSAEVGNGKISGGDARDMQSAR